ncbi:MAG: GNAT family N-acetyltransferase [Pseudomonadota bacterium]
MAAGEAARFRALRLAALRDAPDAFGTTLAEAEALSDAEWGAALMRSATFVASRDGRDCGLLRGWPGSDGAGTARLISFWVAPDARGRGVGLALVERLVVWARGEGVRRLLLDVTDENAGAIALYARAGFRPTGRKGALPPPRAHILEHEMARDL